MANLCDDCAIYNKCMKEKIYMSCVDNDFDSYVSPNLSCEGCFYEDFSKLSSTSPCWRCKRQPIDCRMDNYISKNSERDKYDN